MDPDRERAGRQSKCKCSRRSNFQERVVKNDISYYISGMYLGEVILNAVCGLVHAGLIAI